jgi:hypothetical protein
LNVPSNKKEEKKKEEEEVRKIAVGRSFIRLKKKTGRGNSKVVTVHEDVGENGGIAPRVTNLGTRRRVVSFTSRLLYPLYPFDRRLGGPQSRSGCDNED